jgi:hypothetical protein
MPVEQYRSLTQAQRGNCFPVGAMVDRSEPGFNERYASVRAQAGGEQ